MKLYHDDDKYCAAVVRPFLKRNLDIIRGTSDTELMLRTILTSCYYDIIMHLCWCVFSIIIIINNDLIRDIVVSLQSRIF